MSERSLEPSIRSVTERIFSIIFGRPYWGSDSNWNQPRSRYNHWKSESDCRVSSTRGWSRFPGKQRGAFPDRFQRQAAGGESGRIQLGLELIDPSGQLSGNESQHTIEHRSEDLGPAIALHRPHVHLPDLIPNK